MTDVEQLLSSCLYEIEHATSTTRLEDIRIAVLGKAGKLTELMKALKNMEESQR